MMELNVEQLKLLVRGLIETHDQEATCGECFEQMDQFAELELAGRRPGEVLPLVEAHLRLCRDCRQEYELLLDALRAIA